jgi:acetyl-CoA carboxylase biotin carboxylase subunit
LIRTLLIANRGEIAVRIVRAARELGIRTVAVFSEPDRLAPHVLLADAAWLLGPAPSSESYLHVGRLLEVARASGADAIHPGYGFLSERAHFARAVADAGLVFVGPTAEAIAAMGDKTAARRRMQDAGVPIVPGVVDPLSGVAAALQAAQDIGYPVLLKASAGGGGKGMRVVERSEDLPRAFEAAQREASAAFGDGALYLERYLDRPRHVEIQVLGDTHGGFVHLGERECSIQRRHQKLIEETPSTALGALERAAMGEAAVCAARAVGYVGAGTVEFLYQDGSFYFLEMNTRIQVEHPVTELVTGVDLVAWQLRIAAGEPLDFGQEDVRLSGCAIECRVTSEDPARGFLPSTGTVTHLEVPSGPGVRWDGGIREGFEVSLHYDPLLGKLIVHAPTREGAIARMARALDELVLVGVDSSVPFHRRVMDEPDFRAGKLSIRYVEEHPELMGAPEEDPMARAAAVAAALIEDHERRRHSVPRPAHAGVAGMSAWRRAGGPWRKR